MRLPMMILAATLLTLTSGCSGGGPQERRVEYECGESRLTVTFRGDTAEVSSGGRTFTLPIAISASGARFSDGANTYWEHQGKALFELPDTSYQECTPIPA